MELGQLCRTNINDDVVSLSSIQATIDYQNSSAIPFLKHLSQIKQQTWQPPQRKQLQKWSSISRRNTRLWSTIGLALSVPSLRNSIPLSRDQEMCWFDCKLTHSNQLKVMSLTMKGLTRAFVILIWVLWRTHGPTYLFQYKLAKLGVMRVLE